MAICSSDLIAMTAACNSNRGIKDASLVQLCICQGQILCQLSIPFVVNVDRPLLDISCIQMRHVFKHMKFGFTPRRFEVFSILACFNYNWKLFFPPQNFYCFIWFHFIVLILSILSPDAFQKLSQVNTERTDPADWVEY